MPPNNFSNGQHSPFPRFIFGAPTVQISPQRTAMATEAFKVTLVTLDMPGQYLKLGHNRFPSNSLFINYSIIPTSELLKAQLNNTYVNK
jgi:hypothetical protein